MCGKKLQMIHGFCRLYSGYCIEFISEPFQNEIPKEINFSIEQKKCVKFEIQEIKKGCNYSC